MDGREPLMIHYDMQDEADFKEKQKYLRLLREKPGIFESWRQMGILALAVIVSWVPFVLAYVFIHWIVMRHAR